MSSPEDVMGDAVERLEFDERAEDETPGKKLRQVTRRTALTGGAAGVAALGLQACGGSRGGGARTASASSSTSAASGSSASAIFGVSAAYKFTLVNHVTTNPFFT